MRETEKQIEEDSLQAGVVVIKGFAVILAVLLFSGCAAPLQPPVPETTSAPLETARPALSATPEPATPDPTQSLPFFRFTREDYLTLLDTALKEDGLPAVSDQGYGAYYGYLVGADGSKVKVYIENFSIGNGFELVLYYHTEDKRVAQVFFSFIYYLITDESAKQYGVCVATTLMSFERNKFLEIDSELDLNDIQKDATTFASGDNATFTYIVENEISTLRISPLKKQGTPPPLHIPPL